MMELTKEQLQQIAETDHVQCGDAAAMARQLLSGLEQEPVAFRIDYGEGPSALSFRCGEDLRENGHDFVSCIPLYTAALSPVAEIACRVTKKWGISYIVDSDGPLEIGTNLYAAPQLPQPVVVPDEVIVLLNHLEDVLPDEAFNLIDVKTWNNVSMLSRPEVYRAAMLHGDK